MRLLQLIFLLVISGCSKEKKDRSADFMDLKCIWKYRLDSLEVGENEEWYSQKFPESIELPGALRDYDIGKEPGVNTQWTGSIYDSSWYFNPAMKKYRQEGNVKFPFWLTPDKRYVGIAWYQKEINIPEEWVGKNLLIHLERPHWQTTVWLDSTKVGSDNSLSVPHEFLIPAESVSPGKHSLTVEVDNAIRDIDPGVNSHSISDHTQGNWNGIVGSLKIMPRGKIAIDQVKVTPNLKGNSIKVKVQLNSEIKKANVEFLVKGQNHHQELDKVSTDWNEGETVAEYIIPMGESYKTWSEFDPNVYELIVSLKDDKNVLDSTKVAFGMREFKINDKQFEINGIPVFLRGTTDCSVFPLTGYPPTREEEWARIYEVAKSFGLNHFRFHSYCPPEAAFAAADKAGFYLQVEGPSWAKYSTSLGNGRPIDEYLMKETKRIIDTYGNHPSFVMMAYGNEPSGNYVPYLENWVEHFREYDPQRVFTGASTGSSWAIIENSDFIVRSPPRGLEWKNKRPNSEFDYRNKTEGQERPYVTFEMGQWCVFPNFEEIGKYTGSLKAKNFELFREDLADHHMADLAEEFLMASGKLQASCYKQEIEATLRTPNLAGFQLLALNDFSGQGTALVGVLDAFWDEKGYITAEEFSAFSGPVVPLARFEKFTFRNTENLIAGIEIANFSGHELKNSKVTWRILDQSSMVLKEGEFDPVDISLGNENKISSLKVALDFVQEAQKLKVEVSVGAFKNHWNIWVYPNPNFSEKENEVFVAHRANMDVLKKLNEGQSVLLLVSGEVENGKDVVQYLTPAFWNTSWFRMRPPHTTGIYIREKHPVFKDFPTDYYSDLQWWEISNRQQVMNLKNFDPHFRPIVQPIDTWFLNRRLAMLFEAQVGKGKLMVCSIDLSSNMDKRIVASQLKKSILNYMNSEEFKPDSRVEWQVIQELFEKKERDSWNSYVSENP